MGGHKEREAVDVWWPRKVICSERERGWPCKDGGVCSGVAARWDILSPAHLSTP